MLEQALVVENFRADGVHGERPILYANDADSIKVSQYHYQLWNDPPPVMVPRRLQVLLQQARVAEYVTDRLSGRVPAYHLTGTVYRFERVLVEGKSTEVVLGVRLRLQADGAAMPLVERDELVFHLPPPRDGPRFLVFNDIRRKDDWSETALATFAAIEASIECNGGKIPARDSAD